MFRRAGSNGSQKLLSEERRCMNHEALTWETSSAGKVGGIYVAGVRVGRGGTNSSR